MDSLLETLGTLMQGGGWLPFPLAFAGGLISSASPCVLAMIPLVIGFVGGYAEGSQKKAIQYSLFFALGLTITFVALGLVAGAMGTLFGNVGFFWNYILPPVLIFLGLQLFGVIRYNINFSQKILPKKRALWGALILGLFFGILSAPCATPVLAVIFTFAVMQQQLAYSGGLLLAYALGHWVLVIGAGVSAGFAQKVAASRGVQNTTNYAKKVGGVLLIGVGIYLIVRIFI